MRAWISKAIKWLVSLFIHETVEQVKEQINTPNTIENANTPKPVADKFASGWKRWLRQKQDDSAPK